jgi:hypothetical protein
MEIPLKLTNQDIDFIIHHLGELPSKTGAFLLMMKIQEQKAAAEITQAPVTPIKE